jgi:hypothetical protein
MVYIAPSEKFLEAFHRKVKVISKFTIFTCSHSEMVVNVVNVVNVVLSFTPKHGHK